MSVVLWPSGSNRVKRGGSFDNNDDNLRASNRNDDNPSDDNDNLGFRCVSPRRRQKDRVHGFDPSACCGHGRKTGAGVTAGRRYRPTSGRSAGSGAPALVIVVLGGRANVIRHASFSCRTPALIEEECTIGHGAIIHGCIIRSGTLIGMDATILDDTEIGEECLIGANALVPERQKTPPVPWSSACPRRSSAP